MDIAVLGAGSWGSALSLILSNNNHNVCIYHYNDDYKNKKTFKYFNNINIPKNVSISSNLNDISSKKIIFIALPTQFITKFLDDTTIDKEAIIVNCSKGFDIDKKQRFSLTLTKNLNIDINNFVVLSGPTHAEEVVKKIPTTIVSSCLLEQNAYLIQEILSNNYFRVYTNPDIIGVETGGACKNIISIAAGICIGLNYGDNTISALISRGLQEIIRLGEKLGANKQTFYGLSGLGDLSVTAFSQFSRNRQLGIKIGKGFHVKKAQTEIRMIAEGVNATKVIYEISRKHKINMPIVKQVYSILFNKKNPKLAINELMNRELTTEMV